LAVYHDDVGDYSTNEPTMDGTASLIYLLAAKEAEATRAAGNMTIDHGAITRGDSMQKQIALVFTGDEFADGGAFIAQTLNQEKVKASFFLTGNFYRANKKLIQQLKNSGHYLGSHGDKHLLYCDWDKRDSLLVSKNQFTTDLLQGYNELARSGIAKDNARWFLPPYEWYNDSIARWTKELGLQLVNFTPGTGSNADYTYPGPPNYRNSDSIYTAIVTYEKNHSSGLNGFILLLHIGTDPRRTDKFYNRLGPLIRFLKQKGYAFKTVKGLLHS
jgi:endoglucanase